MISPSRSETLAPVLSRLSQALAEIVPGRERIWAETVGDALSQVQAALQRHRSAAKDPNGLLSEVDETRPTLARQAEELRDEHDDFLVRVMNLRREVARAVETFQSFQEPARMKQDAAVIDFGSIRQQAERLLADLQENKQAETKLVLDSVNTDLGTGD